MRKRTEVRVFEFDYAITEKDYWNFNRYHTLHSPAGKKTLLVLSFIMPVILAIQLVVDVLKGYAEYLIGVAVIYSVFSGIWVLLLRPMMLIGVYLNTVLLKKSGKLPYDSKVILKFDDEFLYEKAALMEIKMSYAKLERIAVGESGVYLYHAVLAAFLIPNHVFTNTVQKYDFLQFIHQKTNLPIEGIL